jgi:ubiquinone/menaquinone biosynthesis C-methylase UbiE
MSIALDLMRALADPTRLRIMSLLRAMELSVGELAQVLGQSQPRVSRHVKILCDARLAARRKEGSWVFLTIGDADRAGPFFHALDVWTGPTGGDRWAVADAAKLVAVRADRAEAAERYFSARAGEWDAMRSLHVAESEVEAAMHVALDGRLIGRLVDIGTGTGRMIELFGVSATRCTGIDRSSEMLRLARGKLDGRISCPLELRQGDVMALPLDTASADTVIFHQVLHYLPSPEAALAEAARILAPGGQILIADFAPHDREELRTTDAHARLGFSDIQMMGWLTGAGFEAAPVAELAGGALTVKIWRGERIASDARLKVVS